MLKYLILRYLDYHTIKVNEILFYLSYFYINITELYKNNTYNKEIDNRSVAIAVIRQLTRLSLNATNQKDSHCDGLITTDSDTNVVLYHLAPSKYMTKGK